MLTAIKFPCTWRDGDGRQHFAVHEFTLGLGPCGKTVIELEHSVNRYGIEIVQTCDDGSQKKFTYYAKDIMGRVEETYEREH